MHLLYLSADPGIPVHGGKGGSIHLRALTDAFQQLGHDVIVASPRIEPGLDPLPAGVRCEEIPGVRPRECSTSREVLRAAKRQAEAVLDLAASAEIDAIYERYSLAAIAGARTAMALDVPLVVEVNAPLRAEERRYRKLRHEHAALRAEQETFAAAGRVLVVSAALAEWLRIVGVPPARVEVMANAPPARHFAPKQALDEHAEVVVGFAGGLKPWHGIDVMLEGFGLALERGARLRLEILGDGPALELLDSSTLPPNVFAHLGHLPHEDALRVLERWDIGLAPFDAVPGFYFSPLKLFEYMAAGLCPVVSDVGDLAEIVERGRAGIAVGAGDARALADALVELDHDRARLRELGANARNAVSRRPSWADNARRVVAAIEALGRPVAARPGREHA
jgi:glycosyltransferase involved in cell wall biosynthesis